MTFLQEPQKKANKFIIFFVLGCFFGAFWVFLVFGRQENIDQKNNFPDFSQISQVFDKKNTLSESADFFRSEKAQRVYSLIRDKFFGFDEKTQDELEGAFVKSLVNSLGDKHSEFFTEEDAQKFQESLAGNFEGIGAVVSENPMGVKIDKVLSDSPAQKSGLRDGDILITVGEKSLEGLSTTEAIKFIRGPRGTKISVGYYRDMQKLSTEITRDKVILPSVEGKILENTNIGHVQINTFGAETPKEFRDMIKKLKTEGAKGFILDFRFNGGGYLDSARDMLSEFLPRKTVIVRVKYKDYKKNETLYTGLFSQPDTLTPIVVLVNEFSASASEIVAGALQDHKRAIIVGKKTYGKGSVQEMFSLGDGTMMKLTIAKWYTPNDKNIDLEGILPDIVIDFKEDDVVKKYDRQMEGAKQILQALQAGSGYGDVIEKFKHFTF